MSSRSSPTSSPTHLQDQHSDLEKWDDQTPDDVSTDSAGDNDHLAKDEMDTARDAVAEGQATAVMWDCVLKPMGKSLIKDPEVLDLVKPQMSSTEDSPVMARAPLLLSESMLFPYREGLSFEQDVWMDQGQAAAFAGALDRPPTSSWEIINPREYEKKHIPRHSAHAQHSSAHRSHVQAVRHRPGRPARRAHSLRATRRRQRRPRPHSRLERRPLLGRTIAQRHHPRPAGRYRLHRSLLFVCLEERRLRAGLRQNLLEHSRPQVFPRERALLRHISRRRRLGRSSSSPPTKALSSSPPAAKWSSSQKASRCRWRASSPRSSSTPRAQAPCTWRMPSLCSTRLPSMP